MRSAGWRGVNSSGSSCCPQSSAGAGAAARPPLVGWGGAGRSGAQRSAGTNAGWPSPGNRLTWPRWLRNSLGFRNAIFLSGYYCKPTKKQTKHQTSKKPTAQNKSLWSRASTFSKHCQAQEQIGSGASALERDRGTAPPHCPAIPVLAVLGVKKTVTRLGQR